MPYPTRPVRPLSRKEALWLLGSASVATLIGCGGGGSLVGATALPTITTQPSSQSITVGSALTLSVVASGSGLAYQWYKDSAALSGATGTTLSLSSADTSDAGAYSVIVSNSAGSVTSETATVTVTRSATAPVIVTHPASTSATAGGSATYSVVATGTDLTYQWYKENTAILGATGAYYTLSSVSSSDVGTYHVVVTNSVGSVSSITVSLTLSTTPVAPSITTQPTAQSPTLGGALLLAVVSAGTDLHYQWYKDGVAIAAATGASYYINPVTASHAGSYYVVISNSLGSATSSTVVVTVSGTSAAPSIVSQPVGLSVPEGGSAAFYVTATGSGLAYQWYKNGTAISGATSTSYVLNPISTSDAGDFTVVVSNSAGSATSGVARLTVTTSTNPTPTPTPTPTPIPSCHLIPTETDGPYPLYSVLSNSAMVRSNITGGKTGVPLTVELTLVKVNGSCGVVPNAYIYIWHCDKDGSYSGYSSSQNGNHTGETFCRGIQQTDSHGKVVFQTIYPGWYAGRITHIHFQVYLTSLTSTVTATSQLAFPQDVTAAVYASSLYAAHGQNTSVTSFAADNVFSDGTTYQLATLTGSVSAGYTASLVIGVNA